MPAEPQGSSPAADLAGWQSQQATISEFDLDTGAGAVLHDDGRREEFLGPAFRAGGLRLLRVGQRVRLDYRGATVVKVTLITLP